MNNRACSLKLADINYHRYGLRLKKKILKRSIPAMIITANISETRRVWTIWHIWLWLEWDDGKGEESIVCVEGEHIGEIWRHYKQALTSHIINNCSLLSTVIMHCMNCNWAAHTHTHSPCSSYSVYCGVDWCLAQEQGHVTVTQCDTLVTGLHKSAPVLSTGSLFWLLGQLAPWTYDSSSWGWNALANCSEGPLGDPWLK